jgi:hypothetical protein
LIKRSLHQSPDHSVLSAKAICKQGEIYKQRKKFPRQCGDGGIRINVFMRVYRFNICQISTERKISYGPPNIKTRTKYKRIILIIKANKLHCFSTLFGKEFYMFRTRPLFNIRSISTLYTAISICHASSVDCLLAWSGWILTTLADSQQNLHDKYL